MNQEEMISIAKVMIRKRYSFEEMKDSDYLYGKSEFADDVWAFVEECEKIGRDAFVAKYGPL